MSSLPLTWPQVVPVEEARRQYDAANRALDDCFQEQPPLLDPEAAAEAMMAALHDADQASVLEHYMRLDAPAWQ